MSLFPPQPATLAKPQEHFENKLALNSSWPLLTERKGAHCTNFEDDVLVWLSFGYHVVLMFQLCVAPKLIFCISLPHHGGMWLRGNHSHLLHGYIILYGFKERAKLVLVCSEVCLDSLKIMYSGSVVETAIVALCVRQRCWWKGRVIQWLKKGSWEVIRTNTPRSQHLIIMEHWPVPLFHLNFSNRGNTYLVPNRSTQGTKVGREYPNRTWEKAWIILSNHKSNFGTHFLSWSNLLSLVVWVRVEEGPRMDLVRMTIISISKPMFTLAFWFSLIF